MPEYLITLKNGLNRKFDSAAWKLDPYPYGLLVSHRENQGCYFIPWTAIAFVYAEKRTAELEAMANG
ncbi:MAG: hypothetical protein DRJ03_24440 [Chloroflexi bacterium]|nr:MAG: hypothetical protein DRJ03_24440 [Chloroflexota bacterium]